MATDPSTTITTINGQAQTIINYLNQYYAGVSIRVLNNLAGISLTTPSGVDPTALTEIQDAINTYNTALKALPFPTAALNSVLPPDLSTFVNPKWQGVGWTSLRNQIAVFYSTATSNAETEAMQTYLINKDVERRNRILIDLYSAAEMNTASKGFLFPNGMTVALKLDAQAKHQFDADTASREIGKMVIEWAKNNYQHAIDKGISAQQLDVEFNMKFGQLLVEIFVAQVKAIIDKLDAEVRLTVSKIDALAKPITALIELGRTNAQIQTEHNRAKIGQYAEDIRNVQGAFTASVQASLEDVKARTTAATAALNGLVALASTTAQIDITTATLAAPR